MKDHGTRTRYTRGGCRCAACRRANTAYHTALRAKRKAESWAPLPGGVSPELADMMRRLRGGS